MNKCFIRGNITGDPEVFSPQGSESTLLTFSIANNDEQKKVGETYQSVPSFFECKFWTKNPQHWIQKIKKGAACYIEGELKQERWEKDGNKFSKVVLNVVKYPDILGAKEDSPF